VRICDDEGSSEENQGKGCVGRIKKNWIVEVFGKKFK